jgi:DNA-directed RNA polymerase specialized sigma24 family protein
MATDYACGDETPAHGQGPCTLRPSEDPSVILAAKRGDSRAFTLLVEDTWPFVCGVVGRILKLGRNHFDVRAVAADVFASLCGCDRGRPVFLAGFDPARKTLRGFLCMVAAADARDVQRSQGRKARHAPELGELRRGGAVGQGDLHALEARLDLLRVVERMSPVYREALLLVDLLGESLEDATPMLDRPTTASTNSLLGRAREHARRIAREMCERDRWDA